MQREDNAKYHHYHSSTANMKAEPSGQLFKLAQNGPRWPNWG